MTADMIDCASTAKKAAWRLTKIQSPIGASGCFPTKMLSKDADKNSSAFRRFGIANSAKKYPRSGTPKLFQNPRKWFCRCIEPSLAATKLTQKIEHPHAHSHIAWVRVE